MYPVWRFWDCLLLRKSTMPSDSIHPFSPSKWRSHCHFSSSKGSLNQPSNKNQMPVTLLGKRKHHRLHLRFLCAHSPDPPTCASVESFSASACTAWQMRYKKCWPPNKEQSHGSPGHPFQTSSTLLHVNTKQSYISIHRILTILWIYGSLTPILFSAPLLFDATCQGYQRPSLTDRMKLLPAKLRHGFAQGAAEKGHQSVVIPLPGCQKQTSQEKDLGWAFFLLLHVMLPLLCFSSFCIIDQKIIEWCRMYVYCLYWFFFSFFDASHLGSMLVTASCKSLHQIELEQSAFQAPYVNRVWTAQSSTTSLLLSKSIALPWSLLWRGLKSMHTCASKFEVGNYEEWRMKIAGQE